MIIYKHSHKNNLDFFEQNDSCPTCTQKIEEKFRDEKIEKERKKVITLNDGMKDLLKEITNTENKLKIIVNLNDRLSE